MLLTYRTFLLRLWFIYDFSIFFVSCLESRNEIVRLITRHSMIFYNYVCANLLICSELAHILVDCLVSEPRYARTVQRAGSGADADRAGALALNDLCLFRYGVRSPGFSISFEEFQCAFSSFL